MKGLLIALLLVAIPALARAQEIDSCVNDRKGSLRVVGDPSECSPSIISFRSVHRERSSCSPRST